MSNNTASSSANSAPSSSSSSSSSADSGKSHKRLSKELSTLQSSPPPYVLSCSLPNSSSLSSWHILISGPPRSPYADGRFVLHFSFPPSYPMRPPIVTFLTPIYHVNVDMKQGGAICQDIVSGDWSPVLRVVDVLNRLYLMMEEPHYSTPLDPEIGEMAQNNPKKYKEMAEQHTKRYAKG